MGFGFSIALLSSGMLKKSASLSCSFGLFGLSGLFGLFGLSCLLVEPDGPDQPGRSDGLGN